MESRTLADLVTPDDRTLRFTRLGFSTGGTLKPETAAELQQLAIASADLVDAVPESVRASFERLRSCHSYGVFWYEAFTVASDLSLVVLEQALRERFIDFYGGSIPVTSKSGKTELISVRDFGEIVEAFRRGKYAKKGWKLRLQSCGPPIVVPRTLEPLMRWARDEGLLHGQRNRRMEPLLAQMRNQFAHGAAFRLGSPNDSARAIRDLAEIINCLWGVDTPGGRLYPAPVGRAAVAVGWSNGDRGLKLTRFRPDQFPDHEAHEDDAWTFILLLAVAADEQLWAFDARYELTTFPCTLLWGPGHGSDAYAWWQSATITTDKVAYLDRLFAIRVDDHKVYLPQRPDVVLGLPTEQRAGTWHLVSADFPLDAFTHVRHRQTTATRGADAQSCACPVDERETGTWTKITNILKQDPDRAPSSSGDKDVHVPRQVSYPADVGYD